MTEAVIDHEVRIRVVENLLIQNKEQFTKIESKMDSHFHWVLGTIFLLIITVVTMFGSIVFHVAKLS